MEDVVKDDIFEKGRDRMNEIRIKNPILFEGE